MRSGSHTSRTSRRAWSGVPGRAIRYPGQIGPQVGARRERAEHGAFAGREQRTGTRVALAEGPEVVGEGTRQDDQVRLREAGADPGGRAGEAPLAAGGAKLRRIEPGAAGAVRVAFVGNHRDALHGPGV